MLLPEDYSAAAIADPAAASLISRMTIEHGGEAFDRAYPEGIPTSVQVDHATQGRLGGEQVMFPLGHARSDAAATAAMVDLKFDRLVAGAVADPRALRDRVRLAGRSAADVAELYAFPIAGVEA